MSAKKKVSQKDQVLDLLRSRDTRGATSREIARELEILNHTARIDELRDEGHIITCERMPDTPNGRRVFMYVLTKDAHAQEPLFDVQPEAPRPASAIGGMD